MTAPSSSRLAGLASFTVDEAWLVDPSTGREELARLAIEDGRIARRTEAGAGSADAPAGALLVVPGFIDLHAHLREPGNHLGETIESGLAAAAHGGFTTVCAMANTTPPIDTPERVSAALRSAAATGSPVRLLPAATITVGRAGRALGPLVALAGAGAAAFSDDGAPVPDQDVLHDALIEAGRAGRVIIEHPEDAAFVGGWLVHDGLAATILGLAGVPADAESDAVVRALATLRRAVAEAPDGVRPRLHLTHLSTAASVEAVRAAKHEGLPVTCDVTPHHLALHEGWVGGDRRYAWDAAARPWAGERAEAEPYDTATRVNPPLRPPADALALAAAVEDGTIDAIATDHAPHTLADKQVEFGSAPAGISGIETALGLVLAAVDPGVLTLGAAIRALTVGPARVLGLPEPSLAEGATADLVIIDRAEAWIVAKESMRSRGRNTPLMGRSLSGRVLLTIAGGRVAYRGDDSTDAPGNVRR